MNLQMLTRGQRYRGPGGEVWWVIDPDIPGHIDHTGVRIEHNTVPDTDQRRAGVWIENEDGEGYWFEKAQYRSLIEGDDFERVEECECCEQSKIVHREQEVTL